MNTTEKGRRAERVAARYFQSKQYKIIAMNWRTRTCEIDIIMAKDSCVYFAEVKYRQNADQGGGLVYITSQKLRQMSYAVRLWTAKNNWQGQIAMYAVEVNGYDQLRFIEITQ